MSMDELVAQVPSIRKQFATYDDFSKVQDITDFNRVKPEDIAERKQINELRSMVYLSKDGKYSGMPLPLSAQLSTIQDFAMNEKGELLYVGNYHDYLTELGKSASNSGGKLSGFDPATATFQHNEILALPHKLNTRAIIPIGSDKYLIGCNNSYQYILTD